MADAVCGMRNAGGTVYFGDSDVRAIGKSHARACGDCFARAVIDLVNGLDVVGAMMRCMCAQVRLQLGFDFRRVVTSRVLGRVSVC